MTEWTERHSKVVSFALHRFAHAARERAEIAAQDKGGEAGLVEAFLADAKAAEEALAMLPSVLPQS